MTADIHILDHYPGLQTLLKHGTKYRNDYLTEENNYDTFIQSLVNDIISFGCDNDGQPREAYNLWKVFIDHVLKNSYKDITNKEAVPLTQRMLQQLKEFTRHFIITSVDKGSNYIGFVCKTHYCDLIKTAMNGTNYLVQHAHKHDIINSTEQD